MDGLKRNENIFFDKTKTFLKRKDQKTKCDILWEKNIIKLLFTAALIFVLYIFLSSKYIYPLALSRLKNPSNNYLLLHPTFIGIIY